MVFKFLSVYWLNHKLNKWSNPTPSPIESQNELFYFLPQSSWARVIASRSNKCELCEMQYLLSFLKAWSTTTLYLLDHVKMTVKLVSFCRLFDAFSIPSLMDSISLNKNLILHPNICLKSALFGEFIFNYMMKHLK